jgi:hypothetical protein
MVLAKPITREDGMVVAGENLELTAQVITSLKNAGVKGITVKGKPLAGIDSSEVDLAKIRLRLGYLFRKYQQDPLMWTLRNMLDQYLERTMAAREELARLEKLERIQPDGANQSGI